MFEENAENVVHRTSENLRRLRVSFQTTPALANPRECTTEGEIHDFPYSNKDSERRYLYRVFSSNVN